MKKIMLFIFLSSYLIAQSQEFPGYRSFTNNGVNGVFFNPASIAGNAYKFDINLFSINTIVGNNKADFNLRSIGRSLNFDSLKKQMFSAMGGPATGYVNVTINGPSLMLRLNNRTAVALTTRARSIANIIDLDGKLAEQVVDDLESNVQLPYGISSNTDMRVAANAWTEIGISIGRTLFEKNQHVLKGGLTLKYLGGVGNGYFNVENLNARIDDDLLGNVYMDNASGTISMGFGGINISNVEAGDFFNFKNSGFGADLGFIYEYRPASSGSYKYKAGISLTDLGSIRYNRDMQRSGSYRLDITGSEKFYFDELSGKDFEEYNAVFQSRPQFFTPLGSQEATYKVALPATVHVDLDYLIKKGFYTSLHAQLPLNSDAYYNPRNYSAFTLTPRFETKFFAFALPVNYNALTNFNMGLALRAGPLFFGSGSVLSALFGSSKQADAHFGLRFGGLKK
ncbi:MAG: hypothetical protein H0U44_00905 [Flavisolibacter sp.]|jgi:hypothetical protein|nr:hypothetical protein [Flavisolibacter sp.]